MTCIQTYVFLDLETTGKDQTNRIKITEISLVAVKREHLLDTQNGFSPRVQHKLTLCVNPRKRIDPGATGLCNDLLEFEPIFDKNLINLLNMFINLFAKPVCLIAFNGLKFDFPILRNHLEKFGVSFAEDVACADCFHAFYDILESRKTNKMEASTFVNTNDINIESDDDMELLNINTCDMKSINESSPTQFISLSPVTPKKPNQVKLLETGRLLWPEDEKTNKMEASTFVNTNDINIESDDDMELLNINTCDMKSINERSPTCFIKLSPVTPKKPNHVRMLETGRLLGPEGEKENKMEASTFINTNDINKESDDDMELLNINTCNMKSRNETSPTCFTHLSSVTPKKPNHVRMLEIESFPWPEGEKPKEKYKLRYIYKQLLNRPARNAHQAENDCLYALECAVALSEEFVKWVDKNNYLFSQIRPMTIGVPLGK